MLKFFHLILMLVAWLLSAAGYAQVNTKNLAFKHILPDQLEAIEYVQHIVQDEQGFMWFGGRNGLARFDGYQLRFYRSELDVPGTISSEQINCMLVTRDGSLWLGTGDGLDRYNADTDAFESYKQQADVDFELRVNDIKDILEWDDGTLWLATRGGLVRFDPRNRQYTPYYIEVYPQNKGDRQVNELEKDGNSLWIGLRTGGLTHFFPDENRFVHYRHNPADKKSISDNDVRSLKLDSHGQLWVGTYAGGLNKLDLKTKQFERYPHSSITKDSDIWDILEDGNGDLWVATGNGLDWHSAAGERIRFTPADEDPRSLSESNIRSLFQDRAGDIWIGLFPSGVNVVDAQASAFRNFLPNASDPNVILGSGVRNTYEDPDGNLWIATGEGLSYYNRTSQRFIHYQYDAEGSNGLSGVTVLSVVGDTEGYIWLGIWAYGLNRLDPTTGEIKTYPASKANDTSLKGKQPWDMFVDADGVLWVATNEGLNRYNRATDDFTFFRPTPEQVDNDADFYAKTVYEDSRRNIWVGSTRGLFKLDKKDGSFDRFRQNFNQKDSLSKDFVLSLYEDVHGFLWVGTKGGGVNKMDIERQSFTVLNQKDGLPSNVVTSIVEDEQGQLWFSTHNGLAVLNRDTGEIRSYFKRQGLPGNLFNRDTGTLTSRGELVFGSTEGLTLFDPKDLWTNTYVPNIVLTDFRILNQSVKLEKNGPIDKAPGKMTRVTLAQNQSVFSFSYAALNYRSPLQNQYAYFLEGFDNDWLYVGAQQIATYTNLDPGTYVFRVKGSNNDGIWNEEGLAVKVHIPPPLWNTWWAYLIYALIVGAIFFFILRFNLKQQEYEREHRLNLSLQELDKLKDEFLANTSHELRTPLNGIIGLSESLMGDTGNTLPEQKKREYIQMIHFSGRRLANLVDDILDFSKLKSHSLHLDREPIYIDHFAQNMVTMATPLIGSKPLELRNTVPRGLPPIFADEKRLQQIFFNLIGNAIKFTDKGSITIDAKQEHRHIVIDIIDTGIGIPEAQLLKIFDSFEQVDREDDRRYGGTGLGLTITKRLVELHNGSISVSSKIGVGSRFTMRFPTTQQAATRQIAK